MNKTQVLLAEDDPNMGMVLKEFLKAKGFEITLAVNGKEGFEKFKAGTFDLCLLDIMMPLKDGFSLAQEIRRMDKNVPIIFLTAKSMKEDTIKGLKLGADDYITKPFNMEELLLRVHAVLRRTASTKNELAEKNIFTLGGYTFNYMQQILAFGDEKQKLTSKETELLRILCINPMQTVERSYILNKIWGDDNYFNGRSMDVYIAKLRKYLKEDTSIEIMNVHGTGYKLLVDVSE